MASLSRLLRSPDATAAVTNGADHVLPDDVVVLTQDAATLIRRGSLCTAAEADLISRAKAQLLALPGNTMLTLDAVLVLVYGPRPRERTTIDGQASKPASPFDGAIRETEVLLASAQAALDEARRTFFRTDAAATEAATARNLARRDAVLREKEALEAQWLAINTELLRLRQARSGWRSVATTAFAGCTCRACRTSEPWAGPRPNDCKGAPRGRTLDSMRETDAAEHARQVARIR